MLSMLAMICLTSAVSCIHFTHAMFYVELTAPLLKRLISGERMLSLELCAHAKSEFTLRLIWLLQDINFTIFSHLETYIDFLNNIFFYNFRQRIENQNGGREKDVQTKLAVPGCYRAPPLTRL